MISLTEIIVLEKINQQPQRAGDIARSTVMTDTSIRGAAARLVKRGSATASDHGDGKDKRMYAITNKGKDELTEWRQNILPLFDRSTEDSHLAGLIRRVIIDQKNGFDALASESWDAVVEYFVNQDYTGESVTRRQDIAM